MNWKTRLEPFARAKFEMESTIHRLLRDMSDVDLRKLLKATENAAPDNCWAATYRVAPFVREEAQIELGIRRRVRAEARKEARASGS